MAGSPSPIQELRTRLEQSRWQLHDGLLKLETRLSEAPPRRGPAGLKDAFPTKDLTKGLVLGTAAGMVALEVLHRLWQRER